jgi:hypothetical protein
MVNNGQHVGGERELGVSAAREADVCRGAARDDGDHDDSLDSDGKLVTDRAAEQ